MSEKREISLFSENQSKKDFGRTSSGRNHSCGNPKLRLLGYRSLGQRSDGGSELGHLFLRWVELIFFAGNYRDYAISGAQQNIDSCIDAYLASASGVRTIRANGSALGTHGRVGL